MSDELIERARYCHEHGIFDASHAGKMVSYGELADRIEALTAEVRRLNYDGIHTCHAECPRLPCVQRREIEALTAVIASLRAENQRLERVLRSIAWPMNEAGPWAQAVAASALPGGADGALKRIEALTIAGDKLAWFAGHEDGCASSVCWADPAPCDCGYREAWKNWQEAREYD